jgi:hypothetical protein
VLGEGVQLAVGNDPDGEALAVLQDF